MTPDAVDAPLWVERETPRTRDVFGIGQNALDRVVGIEALPRLGEKHLLESCEDRPGGQVATAVLACATLGLRCGYAGRIGDDDAGRAALAPLRAAGVDTDAVEIVPGTASQTAVILVERKSGERTILWHRPAPLHLRPGWLEPGRITGARALLLDAGDPEAAAWAAGIARSAGIPVILDADHYRPELEPLLELVDFPLVSQGFAESFRETGSVRECLRGLVDRGARLAAVTLGASGAAALCGDRWLEVPGVAVAAADTTGAGDVFHGAFAWALLEGWGARRVLRAANAAAALNCRAPGAQGGLPDRKAVLEILDAGASEGD